MPVMNRAPPNGVVKLTNFEQKPRTTTPIAAKTFDHSDVSKTPNPYPVSGLLERFEDLVN